MGSRNDERNTLRRGGSTEHGKTNRRIRDHGGGTNRPGGPKQDNGGMEYQERVGRENGGTEEESRANHQEPNGRESSECTKHNRSTGTHNSTDGKERGGGSRDGKDDGYIRGEVLQKRHMGEAPREQGRKRTVDGGIPDGLVHKRAAGANQNRRREEASIRRGWKEAREYEDRPRHQRNAGRRSGGKETVVPDDDRWNGHGKPEDERNSKDKGGGIKAGAKIHMDET